MKKLIVILFLITISCKQNIKRKNSEDVNLVQQDIEIHIAPKSFTLSCGSGCALVYDEKSALLKNGKHEILFNVTMFVNDEETDKYQETYLLECGDNGENLKAIYLKKGAIKIDSNYPIYGILIYNYTDLCEKSLNKNILEDETVLIYSTLPFDFNDYFNICYDPSEECSRKYYSYDLSDPKNLKIKNTYEFEETPSKIFFLPQPQNKKLQPALLAYTDFDVEVYLLVIYRDYKMVSSLKIAEMNGESILDFQIGSDYLINTYTRNSMIEKRKLLSTYKISEEDKIIETEQLDTDKHFKLGKYLKSLIESLPEQMLNPHADHIVFKKGRGAMVKYIDERKAILEKKCNRLA